MSTVIESFEDGLTGWDTLGPCSIVTSTFGITPHEGSQMALLENRTTDPFLAQTDLETFLGLSAGALDYSPNQFFHYEGGPCIKQQFVAPSAGTVKVRSRFLSDSYFGDGPVFGPPCDIAATVVMALDGTDADPGNGYAGERCSVQEAFQASATVYDYETEAWWLETCNIPAAGTYTLVIWLRQEVADADGPDYDGAGYPIVSSAVLIDNIVWEYPDPPAAGASVSTPCCGEADIRLYDAAGNRKYLPQQWISGIDFELLERGGYGAGNVQVLAAWDDMTLAGTEYFDVYLWGEFAYRGWLRQTQKGLLQEGEQQSFALYGLMERANSWQVQRMFAYSTPVDLSVIAEALIDSDVRIAGRYPNLVKSITPTGITLEVFDARGGSLRAALDRLCDYAPNAARWAFDTDSTTADRFVFGPRETVTGYKYSVGTKVESFVYPRDVAAIVNRLLLIGGPVQSPNLIANGSFEEQATGSDTAGNYLLNPGFEDATNTAWTLANGATIRTQGEVEAAGTSRSGKKWLEIDTNGETAKQTVYIIPQASYTVSCWARREDPAEANTFQLTLEGLDSGGNVVTLLYTGAQDPGATGAYIYYSLTQDWAAYPTVERARVTLESFGGTASNDGILVEDVALHDAEEGAASGWRLNVNEDGRFSDIDFQSTFPDPYHGAYCCKMSASNIGAGQDYVEIYQGRDDYVQALPQERYTLGLFFQTGGGGSASIKWGVQEYEADYTLGPQTLSGLAVGNYSTWQFGFVDFMTDAATQYLQVFVRLLSLGTVYIDGIFLCRGEIPAEIRSNGGYWTGENYERRVDVEDTFLTGLDTGVSSSITLYGDREAPESSEDVTDYTSMIAFAEGYFNAHALPKIQAQLRIFDAQALLKPDAPVELLNLPDPPAALFPAVVRYTVGESIDIDADLGNERPEMVSLMGLIANRPSG